MSDKDELEELLSRFRPLGPEKKLRLSVLERAGKQTWWTYAQAIAAMLLAYSWRRTLRFGLLALLAGAAGIVLLAAVQRIAMGRVPTLDLLTGGVAFLQIVALDALVAVPLFVVTGIPRVRGVAPIVFAGLLVFSLARMPPINGVRTSSSSAWVMSPATIEAASFLVSVTTASISAG